MDVPMDLLWALSMVPGQLCCDLMHELQLVQLLQIGLPDEVLEASGVIREHLSVVVDEFALAPLHVGRPFCPVEESDGVDLLCLLVLPNVGY